MNRHFALVVGLVGIVTVFAQSSAIRVFQSGDGTLYLVQDSAAWTMAPVAISESDLGELVPSGELDGAIPAPFLTSATLAPLQAVQASDGTLYLIQGANRWTLVPVVATDADIAALDVVGSLTGTIAAPGLGGPPPGPQAPVADEPPALSPPPVETEPGVVAAPPASATLSQTPASKPPASQTPTNALKIVSSLPRTGPDKKITDTMVNAFRMALNEHNDQVRARPVLYVDMDGATAARARWDAAQEAANANLALNDPGVLAYIGPLDSGAAMVTIPILCAANMVMVSPGVTGIGFTRPQADLPNTPDVFYPSNCKRNFARLAPADDLEHSTPSDWPNQLNAKGRQWYQTYTTRFGSQPDVHALYSYEAMNVVLNAIERAAATNRSAIRDAVFGISNFDGVLGTWSMTSIGDTTRLQAPFPGSR
jgi:ABC-type branched-subunit amino acid transport system substrate-binding protein